MASNSEKFVEFLKDVSGDNPEVFQRFVNVAKESGISGLNSMSDDEYQAKVEEFAAGDLKNSISKAVNAARESGNSKVWDYVSGVAQRAGKYTKNSFNRDFSTLKKFYGEKTPLLALAENNEEMNYQAAMQGTSPDILRKEIADAWEVQKSANSEKYKKEGAEAAAKERERIWNSEKDYLGKAAKVAGRVLLPEFTNWAEESVKSGEEKTGMGKALLKDAAFNAASILGGGAAAKAASLATKNAGRVARIASGAVAGGVSSGAAEAGREALSDYEEIDPFNIGAAITAGGTISGVSKGIASNIGNVSGGKAVSSVVKKSINGTESGAALEAQKFKDAWEATVKNVKGAQNAIQREYSKDLVAQRAKELGVSEKTIRLYIKNGIVPKLYSGKIDDAFVMSYKNIMPEAFKEMGTVVTKGDRLKGGIIAAGLKASSNAGTREPLINQKTATIEKKAEEVGVDPTTIRMWDAGFKPNGNGPDSELYAKYKKLYKGEK